MLGIVAARGHVNIVNLLLYNTDIDLNSVGGRGGKTTLMKASNLEDIDINGRLYGMTPLRCAYLFRQPAIVKLCTPRERRCQI